MKNKILLLLSVLNGILLIYVISTVSNDQVPLSYGSSGEPINYGNKWTYIIFAVLPAILSIVQLMFESKLNNKEKSVSNKAGKMAIPLLVILTTVMGWIFATIMISSEQRMVNESVYSWLIVAIGGWMAYVSNFYQDDIDSNRGIKISWAKDKKVLSKLSKAGTLCGIIGGLIVIVGGVVGGVLVNLIIVSSCLIAGVIFAFVLPLFIAYGEYKKLPKSKKS